MNTLALMEFLVNHPLVGEWLKVKGVKGRTVSYHWFKFSARGGRLIFHKREERGAEEAFSQAVMSQHYRGFRWYMV